MKTTTAVVALIIGYVLKLASFICLIWAIISFVIYLAKDTPFNWNSLYWAIGLTVATVVCSVLGILSVLKSEMQAKNDDKSNPYNLTPKKSRFRERLDQMAEERKRNQTLNN